MKIIVVAVVVLLGLVGCNREVVPDRSEVEEAIVENTIVEENGIRYSDRERGIVIPDDEYVIHAYDKETGVYKRGVMENFIATVLEEHSLGSIIAVDGLKFRKVHSNLRTVAIWSPYPNPPTPSYEPEKETVDEHLREYAHWVATHPHFGHPELPEMSSSDVTFNPPMFAKNN